MEQQNTDMDISDAMESCRNTLSATDAAVNMDIPILMFTLKRFHELGGKPLEAVELLTKNYHGYFSIANLLIHLIDFIGDQSIIEDKEGSRIAAESDHKNSLELVESYIEEKILESFDPALLDDFFTRGEPAWFDELMRHSRWRRLLFKLSESQPECLMLRFAVKHAFIHDICEKHELIGLDAVDKTFSIFCPVLFDALLPLCQEGATEQSLEQSLPSLVSMWAKSPHAFLYSAAILTRIINDSGKDAKSHPFRRLLQALFLAAGGDSESGGVGISGSLHVRLMSLLWRCSAGGNNTDSDVQISKAVNALTSMLTKKQTNPSDIHTLYCLFVGDSHNDSGTSVIGENAIQLIREPSILDLIIRDLLYSRAVPSSQRNEYLSILAIAVVNDTDTEHTFQSTLNSIQMVDSALRTQILEDVSVHLPHLWCSIVCIMLISWIECQFGNIEEFLSALGLQRSSPRLRLLRIIFENHEELRPRLLSLIGKVLSSQPSIDGQQALILLSQKRLLVDLLVDIILCVPGVVENVCSLFVEATTSIEDPSITRHFITQLLNYTQPPFSASFIHSVLRVMTRGSRMSVLSTFWKTDLLTRRLLGSFFVWANDEGTEISESDMNVIIEAKKWLQSKGKH